MQRKRVGKQGVIAVEDTFEEAESYTSGSTCILCHGGEEVGKSLHAALHSSSCDILDSSSDDEDKEKKKDRNVMDPQRIWMSRHPLNVTSNRYDYVHFYCALYSPLSWLYNGKRWCNVAQEVRRSFHFACAICGLKGATLGCMNRKCYYSVHLPCAMEEGWNPSLVNKCSYQCPTHVHMEEDRRNELNQLELNDLSLGREAVEVVADSTLTMDVMSLPYIYTPKNLDSDDTQANVVDIHAVQYCSCTGTSCVDDDHKTTKGNCICCGKESTGNYHRKGPFLCLNPSMMNDSTISGKKVELGDIYECGLRCRCSDRCVNRVVGKGLQFQLQVVSTIAIDDNDSSPRPSKAPRLDQIGRSPKKSCRREEWGVMALEDIPAGAFVCEWTGQYVLGDSKPAIPLSLSISDSMMGHEDRSQQPLMSVVEALEVGCDASRGLDGLGRIVPVDIWESPFSIVEISRWASTQLGRDSSLSSGTNASNASKKRQTSHDSRSEKGSAGLEADPALKDYLKGLIYVDSRYYSNVSRFIKLTTNSAECNICRRCVYINDDGSKLHPRLALFASKPIPAGSNLMLF